MNESEMGNGTEKKKRRHVIPFDEQLAEINVRIANAEEKVANLKENREAMIRRHQQKIEDMKAMLPGLGT